MRSARHGLRARRKGAGFSLVEMMAVVAITGVLAALAVIAVRDRVDAAKSSRAIVGAQAIRVAEEQYKAQGGQYLGCSSTTSPKWYPGETPGQVAYDWRQPTHPDWACWQRLGISHATTTQYSYLVNAGLPGEAYPPLLTSTDPTLPTPATDLWYVIQIKGDIDGDGTFAQGIATSYTSDVYIENEQE